VPYLSWLPSCCAAPVHGGATSRPRPWPQRAP